LLFFFLWIGRLSSKECIYRYSGNAERHLAFQNWNFSNANQHLNIYNQYFSNVERHLGNADRILALQNLHFSNANQHLIIENLYFSNAERHLGNADRILALNWHFRYENQHLIMTLKGTWVSWFLTEQTFQSC
jgi:hypothetical protein